MKLVSEKNIEKTIVTSANSLQGERLLQVKRGLDEKLNIYNPGELLSWWVCEDAFELPERTISQLQRGGKALVHFFSTANNLFYENTKIQKRLEKTITPNYRLLNFAQKEALPFLIRPDVVLDKDWRPKFVELEISVGSRADTAIMAEQYGLDPEKGLVRVYANFIKRRWPNKTLVLITAPHSFFLDLPDDANAFASMLKQEGLKVVVITEENLPYLHFDGRDLLLCQRSGAPITISLMDRFIDLYEIAEFHHPGMAPLFEAYIRGAVEDINTCKQFLDEKEWMALFWEQEWQEMWQKALGEEDYTLLRTMIPRTWRIHPETIMELPSREKISVTQVGDLPKIVSLLSRKAGLPRPPQVPNHLECSLR